MTLASHLKQFCAVEWKIKSVSVCCSPVIFEEHFSEVFEKVWISGAEKSTRDLVHHMFQLWNLLVVRHGIISKKTAEVNVVLTTAIKTQYQM